MTEKRAATETKSSWGGKGVRVRRAIFSARGNDAGEAVFVLGAEDFSQIEECTNNPRGPSEAMIQAAALHRRLSTR